MARGSQACQEGARCLAPLEGILSVAAIAGVPADIPAEGAAEPGVAEGDEKKKRRGRKKSKLEDMFPPYLQVGMGQWAPQGEGVGRAVVVRAGPPAG